MKQTVKMKSRFTAGLVLCAILLTASCGTEGSPNDTSAEPSGETVETVTPEYVFPSYDGEVHVLNIADTASMHCRVDTAETNGDHLNDAQYNAVRRLEDELGVIWIEQNELIENQTNIISTSVLAGDDFADIVYQSIVRKYNEFSTNNYYYNLFDYSEAQLDKPWWLSEFNEANTVGNKLYTGLGYSHLCASDAIGVLNFNEDMVKKYDLELPYSLVKDGTWTYDKLLGYTKLAADLNGQESFAWDANGSATYGLVICNNRGDFYFNFDEPVLRNDGGRLVLNAGTERFNRAIEISAQITSATDGSIILGNNIGDDDPGSYIMVYESGRTMFGMSEIAKTNRMRDTEFTFGVLPYPKLDEEQENYCSIVAFLACGISVPVTCETPERSFAIGDAMHYIYYKDVWPVYREVTLEQKNLRNEESIDMLDIILNSTVPNLADTYAIGSSYINELLAKIRTGDVSFASTLAAHKVAIDSALDEINT